MNELEHTKVMNEYAQKVQEMSKDSFFQDKVIAEESYRILVDAIEKLPPQMKSIMQLALEGKSNPDLKDYYYLVFYFL